ncbi:UPF0547 protein C16orf87 homolog [Apodemus speciosus]|uniref:UPF0547 protein C16orf87 homolog n=1 Tax=Apodemus speciosus TaxID=105296 RepID=A0ABQ0F2B3_APOSI
MSATRAKKVKMATKSCPECDQQIPVACKSCPCGYIFISRKLLNAKHSEKSPPSTGIKCDETLIKPLEKFRKEQLGAVKDNIYATAPRKPLLLQGKRVSKLSRDKSLELLSQTPDQPGSSAGGGLDE